MSRTYPDFQSSYTHEEMVEHFLLTPADLSLVFACRGHVNRCGMALLLKTLPYLGYVPESLDRIPPEVHTFVAAQLGLLWDHSKHLCLEQPNAGSTSVSNSAAHGMEASECSG